MLAGSEGIGGIEFQDVGGAQALGIVALAFILFAGGLDTSWASVRPVLWPSLTLATAGVLLTALSMAFFAYWLLGLPFLVCLLLGSIVSSTDAAAVFAVMRARGTSLQSRIKRTLELESGSNDPMAIFLTVGVIGLILDPNASVLGLIPGFFIQMALGVVLGLGLGWLAVRLINWINLGYDGLYSVLSIGVVLGIYSLTALLGGNGFLAVYLGGLMMGNQAFLHKRSLQRFHDGLAWLMQVAMFVVLGLLASPSSLLGVAVPGIFLALFLMFIARPLGVVLCMLPFRMKPNEIAVISWVGLRGAVPIILSTYPLVANVPAAQTIFNIVFFVVLLSVAVQGPLIPAVARMFDLDEPLQDGPRYPLALEDEGSLDSDLVEVPVADDSAAIGKPILELQLPDPALVVLISRNGGFIVPRGGTVLEPGDRLLVLADADNLEEVRKIVS